MHPVDAYRLSSRHLWDEVLLLLKLLASSSTNNVAVVICVATNALVTVSVSYLATLGIGGWIRYLVQNPQVHYFTLVLICDCTPATTSLSVLACETLTLLSNLLSRRLCQLTFDAAHCILFVYE